MLTSGGKERFGGIARLFGSDGLARLAAARVTVIGIGGVGSWTVEALIRSGVGGVTLIDMDDVCITNTNRQLHALTDTVGRPKVEVVAERMRAINPDASVAVEPEFIGPGNAERLLAVPTDFVIDAIDNPGVKALIIARCRALGRPVLTVGGAGGRIDATAVRCADLAVAHGDPLLRSVRRELRRHHGFPGEQVPFGVPAIHSAEPQRPPVMDEACAPEGRRGTSLRMDCASGWGAALFATGTFGFAAAGEVVRRLAAGDAGSQGARAS